MIKLYSKINCGLGPEVVVTKGIGLLEKCIKVLYTDRSNAILLLWFCFMFLC